MRFILFISALSFLSFNLLAQDFEIPKDFQLETEKDYANLEQDVVKAVDWLINTPVSQEVDKRKDVNTFLLAWLSGSPTVSLMVKEEIVTFVDCPDCFMVYMGAYAKNAILHKGNATTLTNNVAAIEDVIRFYTLNKKAIGKNKAIKKYIKMKKKGQLEKYLKSNI